MGSESTVHENTLVQLEKKKSRSFTTPHSNDEWKCWTISTRQMNTELKKVVQADCIRETYGYERWLQYLCISINDA